MTINLSDNTPRVSYAVAQGVTQTSFTVSFEFFADADLNVYVDNVLKTITTHYTVSGGSGSTGTVTMSVTGATGGSTVVITRDIALERTTDFPASGAFQIGSLNTELDKITAQFADRKDAVDRSLRLQDSDAAGSMELPLKATRAGTVLGFNATTGVPEAGPTIANVNSLSAITANINTVAGISANVTTVAGISANTTTVAGIASNVTTVAGIASNVTAVAGDATDIGAVAGKATEIGRLGTADAVSDLNTLGTADAVSDMNTLAAISANISTVAGVSSNVTTVAGIDSEVTSVAGKATELGRLGTADAVSDMNTLGTADAVSDMNTLAGISGNITTVAGVASNVTTVAGVSANVTTVAGISSNVTTVAGQTTNLQNVTDNLSAIQNASSNATAAANSAAAAAASLDSFDDRYLGSKTGYSGSGTGPSTDNDGNALVEGALFFSADANEMRVYDGSNWIAASSAGTASLILYEYTATSGQTTFSGSDDNSATLSYTANNIQVVMNGVILDPADFTATSGTSVVLASGAATGDLLNIYAYKSFTVSDTVSASAGGTFAADVNITARLNVDNLRLDGNTISSTDTNGDITIDPDGTGVVDVTGGLTTLGTVSTTARDGAIVDYSGSISRFVAGRAGGSYGQWEAHVAGASGVTKRYQIDYDSTTRWYAADGTTERMRLTSGGALLIATATAGGNGYTFDASGFLTHARASGAAQSMVGFKNGGSFVGEIRTSTTATSYITSSDYRLKENVTYDWDATTRLKQLKPARFNFIADPNTVVDGFLAHECSAVPEAVTGTKDEVDDDGNPVMQGIDQAKLVPLLCKTILELEARITALEAE